MRKQLFGLLCLPLLMSITEGFVAQNIIPQPTKIIVGGGFFQLNNSTQIICNDNALADASWFCDWLNASKGGKFTPLVTEDYSKLENTILINCGLPIDENSEKFKSLPQNIRNKATGRSQEDYKIVISEDLIWIQAPTSTGVFYGLQTLRQLLPVSFENGKGSFPVQLEACIIEDQPVFQHRGLLLDCCRHFMSKDFVLRYIDLLALHKMNVLHWHLTEDQGWRIEIKKYPELTRVGAWRTEADGSRYGGFYTQDDIREIVAYASARHITVIPEIEMPGHSVAAIAAYPYLSCTGDSIPVENEWGVFKDIYCAGQESTFEFLEDVLDEVCELFPSPYIHIGGDESPRYRWEHCDKCQKRIRTEKLKNEAELQSWFNERIANYLKSKNKIIIGWDEILEGGIPASAVIQSWRGMEGGEHAAKSNHRAIMSPTSHCYFDYPIEKIDLSKVYSFNPIPSSLESTDRSYIIGGECNMWSEHTPQEVVDQFVFPRILALSEVLWTYPASPDFDSFYLRVNKHLDRLDAIGVNYGFPSYPAQFKVDYDSQKNVLKADITGTMNDVSLSYRVVPATTKAPGEWKPWTGALEIASDSRIESKASWRGRDFGNAMYRDLCVHKGLGLAPRLSYEPSPYYTGGGTQALLDGVLGGDNFRNGLWQAVQGKDMEIVLDFGKETLISSVQSHWFHYANAWIFRPSAVEFYVSVDGMKWEKVDSRPAAIAEEDPAQVSLEVRSSELNVHTRYLKVKAINNGPCPKWHDAPGAPSWLFCDEIIVK